MKKFYKIIKVTCEEDSKEVIAALIRRAIVDNEDYIKGNILIKTDGFEAVNVYLCEGCSNVEEIIKIITT